MTAVRPVLHLFIDHCAPDSAGRAFREAGHDVVFLRERLLPDSPDPLVAAVAEQGGRILVSMDADFRQIAKRAGVGKGRFRSLSLIALRCRESHAAARIRQAISLVEHEWQHFEVHGGQRMFLEIGEGYIRTNR